MITLGTFVIQPRVVIQFDPKTRNVAIVCPKESKIRPVKLWVSVPQDKSINQIIDYLAERDAARFAAAGGVQWYRGE